MATGGYRFPERWSGVLAKGSRFELERLSSEGREGSAAHELFGRERFGARVWMHRFSDGFGFCGTQCAYGD